MDTAYIILDAGIFSYGRPLREFPWRSVLQVSKAVLILTDATKEATLAMVQARAWELERVQLVLDRIESRLSGKGEARIAQGVTIERYAPRRRSPPEIARDHNGHYPESLLTTVSEYKSTYPHLLMFVATDDIALEQKLAELEISVLRPSQMRSRPNPKRAAT